jgi:hypothetical protein
MIWYVAFIAILNLGLGYFIGVRMNGGRPQAATAGEDTFDGEDN